MAKNLDFYEVLGVDRGASQKEIRSAYRSLARKHHPDVNPDDPSAEQRFKEISQAYEVLSSPDKRKQYDRFGSAYEQAQQQGARPGNGGFADFVYQTYGSGSFADIFGDVFGDLHTGGGRARAYVHTEPQRGPNIEHEMKVSFKEAFTGAEKTLNLRIADRCSECEGVGGKTATCPNCNGSGRSSGGGLFGLGASCPQCQGSGQVITGSCPSCGGTGEVARDRRIKVKIPAGVKTGSRVRIAGEGGRGVRGGANGDLHLLMKVDAHPFFDRQGDDIHIKVPVSFPEAALGAKIQAPIPDGQVTVTIPAGTKNGQKLRLKGKGFPRLGGGRGDEYVQVEVTVPRKLDGKQRKAVEELQKLLTDDPRKDLSTGL